MPTVLRVGRYRILIFTNDHGPAHAHVTVDSGAAKVLLPVGEYVPRILKAYSLSNAELRRIQEIVGENADFLIEQWRRLHGEDS